MPVVLPSSHSTHDVNRYIPDHYTHSHASNYYDSTDVPGTSTLFSQTFRRMFPSYNSSFRLYMGGTHSCSLGVCYVPVNLPFQLGMNPVMYASPSDRCPIDGNDFDPSFTSTNQYRAHAPNCLFSIKEQQPVTPYAWTNNRTKAPVPYFLYWQSGDEITFRCIVESATRGVGSTFGAVMSGGTRVTVYTNDPRHNPDAFRRGVINPFHRCGPLPLDTFTVNGVPLYAHQDQCISLSGGDWPTANHQLVPPYSFVCNDDGCDGESSIVLGSVGSVCWYPFLSQGFQETSFDGTCYCGTPKLCLTDGNKQIPYSQQWPWTTQTTADRCSNPIPMAYKCHPYFPVYTPDFLSFTCPTEPTPICMAEVVIFEVQVVCTSPTTVQVCCGKVCQGQYSTVFAHFTFPFKSLLQSCKVRYVDRSIHIDYVPFGSNPVFTAFGVILHLPLWLQVWFIVFFFWFCFVVLFQFKLIYLLTYLFGFFVSMFLWVFKPYKCKMKHTGTDYQCDSEHNGVACSAHGTEDSLKAHCLVYHLPWYSYFHPYVCYKIYRMRKDVIKANCCKESVYRTPLGVWRSGHWLGIIIILAFFVHSTRAQTIMITYEGQERTYSRGGLTFSFSEYQENYQCSAERMRGLDWQGYYQGHYHCNQNCNPDGCGCDIPPFKSPPNYLAICQNCLGWPQGCGLFGKNSGCERFWCKAKTTCTDYRCQFGEQFFELRITCAASIDKHYVNKSGTYNGTCGMLTVDLGGASPLAAIDFTSCPHGIWETQQDCVTINNEGIASPYSAPCKWDSPLYKDPVGHCTCPSCTYDIKPKFASCPNTVSPNALNIRSCPVAPASVSFQPYTTHDTSVPACQFASTVFWCSSGILQICGNPTCPAGKTLVKWQDRFIPCGGNACWNNGTCFPYQSYCFGTGCGQIYCGVAQPTTDDHSHTGPDVPTPGGGGVLPDTSNWPWWAWVVLAFTIVVVTIILLNVLVSATQSVGKTKQA